MIIAEFTATCPKCKASELFYDMPFGMKVEHNCASRTWSIRQRQVAGEVHRDV